MPPKPSPLGRVPPQGAGEVSRQCVFAGMRSNAQPVTALFRHGLRRATFPRGEGFCAINQYLTFIERYRTGWAQWCNDHHRPFRLEFACRALPCKSKFTWFVLFGANQAFFIYRVVALVRERPKPSPLGRVAERSEVGRGAQAVRFRRNGEKYAASYCPLPSRLTPCHLPRRGRILCDKSKSYVC